MDTKITYDSIQEIEAAREIAELAHRVFEHETSIRERKYRKAIAWQKEDKIKTTYQSGYMFLDFFVNLHLALICLEKRERISLFELIGHKTRLEFIIAPSSISERRENKVVACSIKVEDREVIITEIVVGEKHKKSAIELLYLG